MGSIWHNISDENCYMWHIPIMSFRCGIQLWQSGYVLQRNGGASEHKETISLFAGSVISGGAPAYLLVISGNLWLWLASLPAPVTSACEKEQEHCCQGTTSYLCLLNDNCESLASKGWETVDKINSLSHLYFVFLD